MVSKDASNPGAETMLDYAIWRFGPHHPIDVVLSALPCLASMYGS